MPNHATMLLQNESKLSGKNHRENQQAPRGGVHSTHQTCYMAKSYRGRRKENEKI